MNEPQRPPASGLRPQPAAAQEPEDDERAPRPTRPPMVADFIIDRDSTDPLRRFRF